MTMDSTLIPASSVSSSKLPIKRKSPENGSDPTPPPFKFHRIWTEPDEIRFLTGLLDGVSENMYFPRDLNIFYTKFSNTMSQPYTKSQLSEKLRRLRKKFRVICSRLCKGLDFSLLSPHDRALYELSKQLWHPDFAETSPFNAKKSNLVGVKVSFLPSFSGPGQGPNSETGEECNFHDGVSVTEENVSLGPGQGPESVGMAREEPARDGDEFLVSEENVEVGEDVNENENENNDGDGDGDGELGDGDDGKLNEVNVELDTGDMEKKWVGGGLSDGPVQAGIGKISAKVVMDVFDECLKDFRNGVDGERSNLDGSNMKEVNLDKFEERWREQRVAELDVMARRLRLVFEQSLQS